MIEKNSKYEKKGLDYKYRNHTQTHPYGEGLHDSVPDKRSDGRIQLFMKQSEPDTCVSYIQ